MSIIGPGAARTQFHSKRYRTSSMAFLRYLFNEGYSVEEALDIADVKEDLRDEVIRRLESESAPGNETN